MNHVEDRSAYVCNISIALQPYLNLILGVPEWCSGKCAAGRLDNFMAHFCRALLYSTTLGFFAVTTALTLSRWFCACSTTVEADLRSAWFCRLALATSPSMPL